MEKVRLLLWKSGENIYASVAGERRKKLTARGREGRAKQMGVWGRKKGVEWGQNLGW